MSYLIFKKRQYIKLSTFFCFAMLFGLFGCSSKSNIFQENVAVDYPIDYEGLVKKLQQQYKEDSSNFSLLIKLREAEYSASEFYLSRGEDLIKVGDERGALSSFEKGLELCPNNQALLTAKQKALDSVRAKDLLFQAKAYISSGQFRKAKVLLDEATVLDGENKDIIAVQEEIIAKLRDKERAEYLIDLKFDKLEVKKAIVFVAKTYGINVVFDEGVKDSVISLDIEKIPFSEAINILTGITRNAYKVLNQDTLLVFPDTTERRRQYDEISIRTFVLETMKAKDMGVLLRSALGIKNLTINEANNAVILRETEEVSHLAEQLIRANDVSPGEVVLDVEILEVNLTEAEKLGVDYGNYQISTLTTAVPVTGSIRESIQESTTLSIPSINLNAFKQAVDAKMLAKPSVRVLDGQKAKIHIGDRVPLRQSSIQDATGQTRTTFEYQEIGIRFNVEAKIHSSDQVTIQVALEVSALGENLGTATEQAFRIGTRNADTTMLVRDGETAILGGLLREEGRSTASGINGLDTIVALKKIFGSEDISNGRTDLLLTITPNIIRRSNKMANNLQHIAAGTEASMRDRSRINQLDKLVLKSSASESKVISTELEQYSAIVGELDESLSSDIEQSVSHEQVNFEGTEQPSIPNTVPDETKNKTIEIQFNEGEYSGVVGEAYIVSIDFSTELKLKNLELEVALNPNLLSIGDIGIENENILIKENAEQGLGNFSLIYTSEYNASLNVKKVVSFEVIPKRKGTSFLTLKINQAVDENGMAVDIKSNNARFIVK